MSGATEIVTTPSAVSGSIGVVLLHADISKALSEEGVKPTLIFSGRHKVDGNPFEPLSDDVRAGLQAEVDSLYEQFLKTVAAGRGDRLTEEMARATEARTFFGTTEKSGPGRCQTRSRGSCGHVRIGSGRTLPRPWRALNRPNERNSDGQSDQRARR
ncbi:S49 family peptidase [Roseibium salinum]|nr:S49 family peptidase [Roseibium salinum]